MRILAVGMAGCSAVCVLKDWFLDIPDLKGHHGHHMSSGERSTIRNKVLFLPAVISVLLVSLLLRPCPHASDAAIWRRK